MSDQNIPENETNFDFEGDMAPTDIHGFEYKNVFSPSEPLNEMPLRMELRIKQIRKMRKKNIFSKSYIAPKN